MSITSIYTESSRNLGTVYWLLLNFRGILIRNYGMVLVRESIKYINTKYDPTRFYGEGTDAAPSGKLPKFLVKYCISTFI